MRQVVFLLIFMCSLLLLSLPSSAQSPDTVKITPVPDIVHSFSVNADMMTRGEFRYGGMQAEDPNDVIKDYAAFFMERVRLRLDYQYKFLNIRLAPQHAGIWGQQGGGAFKLHETWIKLTARNGLFMQVGRQALNYDDQRIIGSDDWTMTAASHDIVKVGFEGKGHKLHLVVAYNQNNERLNGGTFYENGAQPYKTMQTLWYHYDTKINLGFSLLFMNVGVQAGDVNNYQTKYQHVAGAFLQYRPRNWNIEGSFYYQFGKEEHNIAISAYVGSGKAAYEADKWGVSVGYDYLSGDPNFLVPAEGQLGLIRHETIRGFCPLFGSHHKFYGAMDFFYMQTYVNGFTPGLQNAFLSGYYRPAPKVDLTVAYHFLAPATAIRDHSKALGHELELNACWIILPFVQLSGGYTFMFGTETMEFLKRKNPSSQLHWGWLMLRVNPELFNYKK